MSNLAIVSDTAGERAEFSNPIRVLLKRLS